MIRARARARLLALATLLATCLAPGAAWGHKFPARRTVVVQVERCELVLLVGYRPATGAPTDAIVTRAASGPKSQALDALRALLTHDAMAPLQVVVDGVARAPTSVRAKIGVEPGGARPEVVVLVTYALPAGAKLAVRSADPRSTRISWTDRASARVVLGQAPAQGRWFDGVASFLLPLGPRGGQACATLPTSSPRSRSRSR